MFFDMSLWFYPAWFIMFGALLTCSALALLAEYRKIFLQNPLGAMSVETLLQVIFRPALTPAYLGSLLGFIGLWFVALGLFVLCLSFSSVLYEASNWAFRKFIELFPLFKAGPNAG